VAENPEGGKMKKRKAHMKKRKAHIKIDKVIDKCLECNCFFSSHPIFPFIYICEKENRQIEDENTIPSWCPFLIKEEEER